MKIRYSGLLREPGGRAALPVSDTFLPEPANRDSWEEVLAKFGRNLGLHKSRPNKSQQDDGSYRNKTIRPADRLSAVRFQILP
jgi:hypothetical protein